MPNTFQVMYADQPLAHPAAKLPARGEVGNLPETNGRDAIGEELNGGFRGLVSLGVISRLHQRFRGCLGYN